TNSSTSPADLLAASGIADFTASRICIIRFQSDGERLPGSCCSIVSLTSGPIKRAQTAKKVLGWFSAVLVCRPLSLQVFAKSSKKSAEKVWPEPTGLPGKPEGLPDTPWAKVSLQRVIRVHSCLFILLFGCARAGRNRLPVASEQIIS